MNRIREIREKRGLTQKVVSEQLNIPVTTFSQYERGDREPKVATWIKLSELFNTSIDYLVGNAPTIEMTEDEYEIFLSCYKRDDISAWIDAVIWERVDCDYPKPFQAWLYPETIRVVDK